MSELGPEARALIEGTREADDPSEQDRARVRAKLALAMAAATGTATAATTAKVAAHAGAGATLTAGTQLAGAAAGAKAVLATSVTAKVSMTLAAAALSVATASVVLPAVERTPREERAVPAQRARIHAPRAIEGPAVEPPVVLEPPLPEMPALAPTEPRGLERTQPTAVRAPQRERRAVPGVERLVRAPLAEAQPPVPPSLRAELDLLDRAQAALRANDHEAALELVREHALRFPSGVLTPERQVLRARAQHAREE